MIEQATQGLIDLIKTVPEFENRVGTSVGGTDIDPTMSTVPLPFAWIIFDGDQAQDSGNVGKIMQQVQLRFVVQVVVPNGTQTNMLTVQYPFLESVIGSVRGQDGPVGAFKWKYEGQVMDSIQSDYIRFEQYYSITGHYK
jgi:hypothetical protein